MLLSLTAAYSISSQVRGKKIMNSNNEQPERMVRSAQKTKFTFDDGTAVEPEGDASLDVFNV